MKQSKSFMSELNATCSHIVQGRKRCNICGDLSNVESKNRSEIFPKFFILFCHEHVRFFSMKNEVCIYVLY